MQSAVRLLRANLLYFCIAVCLFFQSNIFYAIFGVNYTPEQYYGFTIAMEGLAIGLPSFLMYRYNARHYKTNTLDRTPHSFQLFFLLILVGMGLIVALFLGDITMMVAQLLGGDTAVANSSLPVPDGPFGFALMLFAAAFLPALCEELALRGVIYEAYRPFGRHVAVIVSGILFALMHGNPLALPTHLLLGLVLGFLLRWTGSLWVSILYHFLHNAFTLMLYFSLRGTPSAEFSLETIAIPGLLLPMAGFLVLSIAIYLGMLLLFRSYSRRVTPTVDYPFTLRMKPLWLLPVLPALGLLLYRYILMGMAIFG